MYEAFLKRSRGPGIRLSSFGRKLLSMAPSVEEFSRYEAGFLAWIISHKCSTLPLERDHACLRGVTSASTCWTAFMARGLVRNILDTIHLGIKKCKTCRVVTQSSDVLVLGVRFLCQARFLIPKFINPHLDCIEYHGTREGEEEFLKGDAKPKVTKSEDT